MTNTKNRKRNFTPEQKAQLVKLGAQIAEAWKPNMDSINATLESFRAQQEMWQSRTAKMSQEFKAITKSIKPVLEPVDVKCLSELVNLDCLKQTRKISEALAPDLKRFRALQADLHKQIAPIMEFRVENAELLKVTVESLEITRKQAEQTMEFYSSLQRTEVYIAPEPYHQKPMHPSDAERFERRFERLEVRLEAVVENREKELPQPSIFSWKSMNLEIENEVIKLTPLEKSLCCYIFKDPSIRGFSLEQLERATYGEVLSNSNRLTQVLKRINGKVRKAGFPNIFSWDDGFLSIDR